MCSFSLKSSPMSSLERWIAGVMMCEGRSRRSCTMYSPRSVSTTSHPASASAGLSSISSVAIDLPLTTRRAPRDRFLFDPARGVTLGIVCGELGTRGGDVVEMASGRILELAPQLGVGDCGFARGKKILWCALVRHRWRPASVDPRDLAGEAHHGLARRVGRGMAGILREKALEVVERG